MWKHIIIQSLVQIILLVVLYLAAPEFIKEQNLVRLTENKLIKYCYSEYPGKDIDHIIYGTEIKWVTSAKLLNSRKKYCGKYAERPTLTEAYIEYVNSNCATTHMCLIFNIFVFYTLFNQINCRVIDDSFNILIRMTKSLLFPLIFLLEMGLQVIIIYIGKSPFHVINDGFTGEQWGICFGFSAITFLVSFIVKLIPLEIFIDKIIAPKKVDEENEMLSKENNNNNNIKIYESQRNLAKVSKKDIEINSPMGEILSINSDK
jgi:magnesium-transporting ATPase (P-type)